MKTENHSINRTEDRHSSAHIPVDRFSGDEVWLRTKIESSGLPLTNIKAVKRYFDLESILGGAPITLLGGFHLVEHTLELNDAQLNMMRKEQHAGILIHELAHANSPLDAQLNHVYGSPENIKEAQSIVTSIGLQSLVTGKYFSKYHKMMAKQYKAGLIPLDRYLEEAFAITVEMRYKNRNHLLQVSEAQRNIMRRRFGKSSPFIAVTSNQNSKPEGIDKVLLRILPSHIKTVNDIDVHVSDYIKNFDEGKKKRRRVSLRNTIFND